MYIKLGNTNINYGKGKSELRYMIISDIVDSKMSYEKPVLVNSIEELDIWFPGKFKDRGYLASLLKNEETSLYLSKPFLKSENNLELPIKLNNPRKINLSDLRDWKLGNYRLSVIFSKPIVDFKLSETFCKSISVIEMNDGKITIYDKSGYAKEVRPGDRLIIDEDLEDKFTIHILDSSFVYNQVDGTHNKYRVCYNNRLEPTPFLTEIIFSKNESGDIISSSNKNPLSKNKSDIYYYGEDNLPIWNGGSIYESELSFFKLIKKLDEFTIDEHIWDPLEENFIPISDIPTNGISTSLDNRDTIAILRSNNTDITYTYPRYSEKRKNLSIVSSKEEINFPYYTSSKDLYEEKTSTFALKISFDRNTFLSRNGYAIISILKDGKIHSYIYKTPEINSSTFEGISNPIDISDLSGKVSPKKFITGFTAALKKNIPEISIIENKDDSVSIISNSYPILSNYYFSFPKVNIEPDYIISNILVSNYFLKNDLISIGLYSKTIGTWDRESLGNDGDIKVKIEITENSEFYRFTISKFGYSEVFEGSFIPKPGNDTIDNKINKQSKLIYCKPFNISEGIIPGEYILKNYSNIEESPKPKDWMNTLELMHGDNIVRKILSDFFVISDMTNYVDSTYLETYQEFLEISKRESMQFLIQNSESKYKIREVQEIPEVLEPYTIYKTGEGEYSIDNVDIIEIANHGNDYILNIDDPDNRLIYFYNPIYVGFNELPGYGIYLNSIFEDGYPKKATNILYNAPGGMTTYKNNSLENDLDRKKSNYLTFDNHSYYYNKINNGKTYNTTGYLRFAIGKIARELEKNKGAFLSEKNLNEVYRYIKNNILGVISSKFYKIIKSIILLDFEPSFETNSLNITLDTKVSEFVDDNIVINLTINYNNNE